MQTTSIDSLVANRNEAIVKMLYKALEEGDTAAVAGALAADLEWWFHGPQNCHHMMRLLTGKHPAMISDGHLNIKGDQSHETRLGFRFKPRSVEAVGEDAVIAEGWEGAAAYWVHVWTVEKGGLITQLREYFNTWLTVKDFRPSGWVECHDLSRTLWRSRPRDLARRSLPGLLLAI